MGDGTGTPTGIRSSIRATYPARSAALTGTHDTETLAGWWTNAGSDERAALTRLLSASLPDTSFDSAAPWSDSLRDAILETMYRSSSDELFLPVQDVFGWFHRINVPATVGEHNWTWRLPWPVDRLDDNDVATERKETLAAPSRRNGPEGAAGA